MSQWQEVYLTDAFDISSGLSKPAEDFGSGFPFLSFKEIFNNFFVPDELSELVESSDEEREKCSVKRGDVFLTRTSETVKELGMSCVALKDYENATFNGFTKRLRPNGSFEIVPEYAGYYFRSSKFRNEVTALSSASTRASLNIEMIGRLKIILPNKEEQEGIAAVLICLDRKIENLRKQNETLEAIAQAIFKHWFVDFEFPNEDGKPYKSSGGEMKRSELGEIPVGWRVEKLGEIASFSNGKSPPERNENSKIPIFGSNGVIGNTTIANNQKTVIIGRVGSYCGSLYYFLDQCWVTDNAMTGRLKKHKSHAYLYLFLASIKLNKLSGGSGQPLLNQSILSSIELAVPDDHLIQDFEEITNVLFRKIFFNQNSIRTLTETRDVLLPQLMSGKLRITDA